MASVEDQAWVTLATNDSYALGALTLGQSLRRVATTRKLVVLITPSVTESMRETLGRVFDLVQEVNVLDSNDSANLALLTRPDLGITFTKLHCWRLTQYKKCVFLDADTLVIRNCDELFDREELSAAPDVGWPDCFNSGVFVYQPSNETYQSLLQCAVTTGSFDGGDQGLLNTFFSSWATKDIARHLPFIYNMTSSASYSYLPAYICFGKDVKIVHFIGPVKPWMHRFNSTTGRVETAPGAYHALEHLQFWWDIFLQDVKPQLQPELEEKHSHVQQQKQNSCPATIAAGLAGQLALITLGQEISLEQKALEDRARQFSWEQGQMDYLGADAFANIQKKLDEALVFEPDAPQPTSAAPATECVTPQAPVVEAIPIAPVVLPEVSTLSMAISQEIVSQSLSSVPLEASQVTPTSPVTVGAPEAIAVKPDSAPTPVPTQPAPVPPEASALPSPPPAVSQPQQPALPVTVAPAAISLAVVPCPPPVESNTEPISPPPALPPPPSKMAPPTPPVAEPISPPPSLPPPSMTSPGASPVAVCPEPVLPAPPTSIPEASPAPAPKPTSPTTACPAPVTPLTPPPEAPPMPGPKPTTPTTKGPAPATPPVTSPAPTGPTPASPSGKAPAPLTPPTSPSEAPPAPGPKPTSPTAKGPAPATPPVQSPAPTGPTPASPSEASPAPGPKPTSPTAKTPTTPPVAGSPSQPLASAPASSAAEPSQQAAAPPGKAAKGTPQAAGGGAPKQKGGKKPKNP